jgi:osmotically inducible lipoprotein OsmB
MREPDLIQNVGNQPNFRSGKIMKTLHKIAAISVTAIALTAMTGCSTRDKNTAIRATVGAVGGAILTGGSGIGTAGGAAVGGVIGHQIGR